MQRLAPGLLGSCVMFFLVRCSSSSTDGHLPGVLTEQMEEAVGAVPSKRADATMKTPLLVVSSKSNHACFS